MQIKTLAYILQEQNLTKQEVDNTVNTQQDNPSPYFEDDPAFLAFVEQKTKQPRFNNTNTSTKRNTKNNINKKTNNTNAYTKVNVKKPNRNPIKPKKPIKTTIANDNKPSPTLHQTIETKKAIATLDNLPAQLKAQLKTPEEKQAELKEIKDERRLRWLAFYYLSTREHSSKELKQKLLAKGQDSDKIDKLLIEFAEKGYQSDTRTAFMLIREGIRKGRGRRRIKQDFIKRKINLPANIDELIDMANEESDEFIDYQYQDHHLNKTDTSYQTEAINWLHIAVEARVKKYGDEIPTDNKDKAKQLRFLQYRGFQSDICFEALQHNLTSLQEI